MNSLQISDVTNYDFKLLGNQVELVVHQVNFSTVIHLLPARQEAPIPMGPTPAAASTPTPESHALPAASKSTIKRRRKRSKAAKSSSRSSSRPLVVRSGRLGGNGKPIASKLTETEVRMIRELWPAALDEAPSKRQALLQLGEMFDISAANIDQIVRRNTWKNVD